MSAKSAASAKNAMIRLCHSLLDSRTLRIELLKHLRTVIPFDYVYFSTTDPATQLMTHTVMLEQPPAWVMPVFLDNEFLRDDVMKFSDMVRTQQSADVLSQATRQDMHHSPRYREMLLPLALDDELRAVFVTDGVCWGTLCLHRERSKSRYTPADRDYLAQLAPHIADGLRKAVLMERAPVNPSPDAPGVLVLTDNLSIVAKTAAAEYWLRELADTETSNRDELPLAVRSVVAGLKAIERGLTTNTTPKVRLHMRTGQWLMLYASRLHPADHDAQITVIFEIAQPMDIAPLIIQAYLLTKREGEITQCVLRGLSTTEIATHLHISPNTVQDHLKAIFAKVDVNSRGELSARIFTRHYQPKL